MKELLLFAAVSLIFGLVFYDCAPRASKSRSTDTYQEDLSGLRPKIESAVVEEETGEDSQQEFDRGPYVPPENDVTQELAVALDRIAEYQSQMPVTVYTVQVYTGRSREEANKVRSQVYQVLAEEEPRLTYQQPNYKVRVGSYFERADAYKTYKALKEHFSGAILLPEKIVPEDSESEQ